MFKQVTYEELPEDIKKRWKKDYVQKVFTQLHNGNVEYVIVPVDQNQYVEWWSQHKHTSYVNPNLDPNGWSWNGHYGQGRPPWTRGT